MKNSLKKLMASATAVAIVTMNMASFTANAANVAVITVNGDNVLTASEEVTTVAFTPVTALTDGSTFNIYYPNMTDAGLVDVDITVANGATDMTADDTAIDLANNMITVTVATAGTANSPVTLTFANTHFTAPASGDIRFAVTTSVGDAGAQLVYVGGSNIVNVTAVVQPTLKMDLSANSIALGVLSTSADTYTEQSLNVTTATNAQGGVVVAMASAGLKDTTIDREIGVTDIAGNAQTAGTDYYKISKNSGAVDFTDAGADFTTVAGADMLATQNVVTGGAFAAPHNDTVTKVTIGARADTTTEAGNYSDVLTFTATGTF